MTKFYVIMFYIILAFVILYPPAFLAMRTIEALSQRKPTIGERIVCCMPGPNICVIRKQLYNSCMLPKVAFGVLVTAIIFRIVTMVMIEVIPVAFVWSSIAMIFSIVLCWICFSIVIADLANCIGKGLFVKVLAFVLPPLAQFLLAKDVVPLVRAAQKTMEEEAVS